jgi:hypothetical protein
MGMDSVELVMGFEEAFGIAIPDEEAARMRTPRRVLDFAAARVPTVRAVRGLTQRTFYALRRAVRAQLDAAARLAPATPLRTLAPDRDAWPVVWTRIRIAAGEPEWPESVPWHGRWSGGPATLGELARHVAAQVVRGAAARGEPWTREGLELTLREVVWDVVGVRDFALDDDFVHDLRID